MKVYLRVLLGFVLGLAGLVVTAVVVLGRVGFLVDTPRAAHPILLVLLFAIPAIAGAVIGLLWRGRATAR